MKEPAPPSGIGRDMNWFRQLLSWAKSKVVLSIEGYKKEETNAGVTFKRESQVPSSGRAAASGATRFRGVWTAAPVSPYMVDHEVVIQAGVSKGTYVSVIDNNANDPATGIGWVQIAPGTTVGTWA